MIQPSRPALSLEKSFLGAPGAAWSATTESLREGVLGTKDTGLCKVHRRVGPGLSSVAGCIYLTSNYL